MTREGQRGNRRAFLRGMLATGLALPAGSALAQMYDPYTGQPAYGVPQPGGMPDQGLYQVNQPAEMSRNQSSFRARHWSEFYSSLGKGVLLADVTSRAVHYWSANEANYMVFPCSIPMSEDLTRRGKTEVVRKAVNPSWTPTASMREKDPSLPQRVEGGSPDNPLGVRAMYLSWPAYLVHGTHDTRKIGRKSSSGCFGLYNEHVVRLYDLVEVGTQVTVF